MSGEEIRFIRNDREVVFELGKKVKNDLKDNDKKVLQPLFDAIINFDGNKNVSEEEMEMLENLQTIFANRGLKNDRIHIDGDDIQLVDEFKKSNMNIKDFIADKIEQINNKTEITEPLNEQGESIPPATTTIMPVEITTTPTPEPKVTQAMKNKSFNDSMQLLAKRKFGERKDQLSSEFTQKVQYKRGKYLYNIAKEALQKEGNPTPSAKDINERIAQIALVNDIENVNNVPENKFPLKVGRGAAQPVAGNYQQPPAVAPGAEQEVPVGEGLKMSPDPDVTGWTENTDAQVPEGVELNNGALKTYTKGEGDNAETKYIYEHTGIKVEAANVEELKSKIETIKTAQEALSKTLEAGEAEEAVAQKIQGYKDAIQSLMNLGTESAVKHAQSELFRLRGVHEDFQGFYEEKTIAMLNSGNVALIEQMFTRNDGSGESTESDYRSLINNNPKIQCAIGAKVAELREKYNNSTITLGEQKILAKLEEFVGKVHGISIEAKAAVPEVKEGDVVKTPAQPEVFAKDMFTDKEGNSYYKAKLGDDGEFKDVEFRAKDDKVLDAFLADLEVADTDEKKTALFKKYAGMENPDPELLKSIAQNASKLKADAETLKVLVANSNLDVIYALDTSHVQDVEADATTGTQASQAGTELRTAINTRIKTIMNTPELAKLPENAKYLERIAGVDIAGQQTVVTKTTDISDWGELTVVKYVKTAEGYAKAAEDSTDTVDVKAYTKDGKPVYQMEVLLTNITYTILEAGSAEALLNLKQDIEALHFDTEDSELDDADKAKNLANFVKLVDLTQDKTVLKMVASQLKTDIIDKNDPDAKALVQKLLLTRDADIVRDLTHKPNDDDYEVDNTLFINDPVALKTLAAMFKEIRDLENQGVKLTPEQIALKDVLDDLDSGKVSGFGAAQPDGNRLRFDGNGNLAVHDGDYSSLGDVANNSATVDRGATTDFVINDPIVTKDKYQLASYISATRYSELSKDEMIKLINLDTVDAELLSYIDFNYLNGGMSDADIVAVEEAYVAKAKSLFTNMGKVGDTEQLNPANARYLKTILEKIDSFNDEVKAEGKKTDADDAVIGEILDNFFEITGEGENAVTTIKNFRRFTYEEMNGLASAVNKYGTPEQMKALVDSIKLEDVGAGQFAEVLQNYAKVSDLQAHYATFIDQMETKEDVLNFIDNLGGNIELVSYDKVLEKFKDTQFVLDKFGPQVNEANDVLRKLTWFDVNINNDGLRIRSDLNIGGYSHDELSAVAAQVGAQSGTMEEFEKQVNTYLEIQNIMYENRMNSSNNNPEVVRNNARLNELYDQNDEILKQEAVINMLYSNGAYDETLTLKVLADENLGIILNYTDYDILASIANRNTSKAVAEAIYNLSKTEVGENYYSKLSYALQVPDVRKYLTDEQKEASFNESLTPRHQMLVINKEINDSSQYAAKVKEILTNCNANTRADIVELLNEELLTNKDYYIMKPGDSIQGLLFKFVKEHLNVTGKIGELAQEKSWGDAKINQVVQDYVEFLISENQLQAHDSTIGTVIDFNYLLDESGKFKAQPNWFHRLFDMRWDWY